MKAFIGLLTCGFVLWLPLTRSGNGNKLQSQPSRTLFTAFDIAELRPGSPSTAPAKLAFGNDFESMIACQTAVCFRVHYATHSLQYVQLRKAEYIWCSDRMRLESYSARTLIGYFMRLLLPSEMWLHMECSQLIGGTWSRSQSEARDFVVWQIDHRRYHRRMLLLVIYDVSGRGGYLYII